MLGQTLVTHQTGPEGKLVSKVLVAIASTSRRNITSPSSSTAPTSAPIIIASTEGGMNIEEVAEKTPEKIIKEPVHPHARPAALPGRKIAGDARLRAAR